MVVVITSSEDKGERKNAQAGVCCGAQISGHSSGFSTFPQHPRGQSKGERILDVIHDDIHNLFLL